MSINLFYFSLCILFSNQLSQKNCDAATLTKFHGSRDIFFKYAVHRSVTKTQPVFCLVRSRCSYYTTSREKTEDSIVMSVKLG